MGTIERDTKDWTWVLQRPCPECGLEAAAIARDQVAPMLLQVSAGWLAVLAEPSGERPRPSTWSPLEYACHVRDVLRLYLVRLRLMLEQDDPLFADWDQDAAAEQGRYGEQEPPAVARELEAAAREIAGAFQGLTAEQWLRPGRRTDGASFTVESFARYLVHDPVHHLHDVQRA